MVLRPLNGGMDRERVSEDTGVKIQAEPGSGEFVAGEFVSSCLLNCRNSALQSRLSDIFFFLNVYF